MLTITTYLGEQLSTEPDRLKLEIENDGTICGGWIDGKEVEDDLLDVLGREEFDRVQQLAIDTAYAKTRAKEPAFWRLLDEGLAATKERQENRDR